MHNSTSKSSQLESLFLNLFFKNIEYFLRGKVLGDITREGLDQNAATTTYKNNVKGMSWDVLDSFDFLQGDWNIVYATPISPGRSRIFVRVVFEVAKIPMPLQQIFQVAFSKELPPFFTHLSNHKVLEDDNIFLHHQGQTMAPGGKQDTFRMWFILCKKSQSFPNSEVLLMKSAQLFWNTEEKQCNGLFLYLLPPLHISLALFLNFFRHTRTLSGDNASTLPRLRMLQCFATIDGCRTLAVQCNGDVHLITWWNPRDERNWLSVSSRNLDPGNACITGSWKEQLFGHFETCCLLVCIFLLV